MSEELSEIAKLLDQSSQSVKWIKKKKNVCACVCVGGTMDFYPPHQAAGVIYKQEVPIKTCQDYSFTPMKLDR